MPLFPTPQFQDEELKRKKSRLFSIPEEMPQIDTSPIEAIQPVQTQPEGSTLKQKLFGYSEPRGTDELGIEKPSVQYEGIVNKVAKYLGPALFGLAGGVGILPGVTAAYAGDRAEKATQNALDQSQYKGDRNAALLNKKIETQDTLANRRADQQEKYQNSLLGLDWAKLGLEKEKSKGGGLAQMNKDRDDERAFRQDYLNNPINKEYNEAATGFKKIEETANSKDPSGFSDQALIFNFNKVMDPGSVVREGEYNATMKNASLFDQFGINVQKVLSGQKLSPEMRKRLYETAKLQLKAHQGRFEKFRGEQSRIAKEYNFDPRRVIPDIEEKQNVQGPPNGATGKAPGPDGRLHYHDAEGNDLGPV